MNIAETLECVTRHVAILHQEWRSSSGMILTEADLQSHIFTKLATDLMLSASVPMATGNQFGKKVHCALSWYGLDENLHKLCITPDITILNPSYLSLTNNVYAEGLEMPSKGYSFKGNAIVFEIKFQRYSKMTDKFLNGKNGIDKDAKNLKILIEKFRDVVDGEKVYGVQIVFDRSSDEQNEQAIREIFSRCNFQNNEFQLFYCQQNPPVRTRVEV